MFGLLQWTLERLSQPSLPTFPVALATLQVTSETRMYLLLLDLEDSDLVEQWMNTLLSIAR